MYTYTNKISDYEADTGSEEIPDDDEVLSDAAKNRLVGRKIGI